LGEGGIIGGAAADDGGSMHGIGGRPTRRAPKAEQAPKHCMRKAQPGRPAYRGTVGAGMRRRSRKAKGGIQILIAAFRQGAAEEVAARTGKRSGGRPKPEDQRGNGGWHRSQEFEWGKLHTRVPRKPWRKEKTGTKT
jgi:hypothetical protein